MTECKRDLVALIRSHWLRRPRPDGYQHPFHCWHDCFLAGGYLQKAAAEKSALDWLVGPAGLVVVVVVEAAVADAAVAAVVAADAADADAAAADADVDAVDAAAIAAAAEFVAEEAEGSIVEELIGV